MQRKDSSRFNRGLVIPIISLGALLLMLAASVNGYLTGWSEDGLFGQIRWQLAPQATTTPLPDSSLQVALLDESETWNWTADECGPALAFTLEPYPLSRLMISLTDQPTTLPMGVAYPTATTPQALVRVWCEADGESLGCELAVEQGGTGPALDVAASAALGYGIWDAFRDRTRQATSEESATTWDWSRFQPLITPQGEDAWQSACLTLSAE